MTLYRVPFDPILRVDDYLQWGSAEGRTSDDFGPALEDGRVVFLSRLRFETFDAERPLFSASIVAAKNVSYDPPRGRIRGANLDPAVSGTPEQLHSLLHRFSDAAHALVCTLFPRYVPHLQRARASFRPAEIAGRPTSWRHDDTRLHIDAFPATPSGGRRILRVFTNVNPQQQVRRWRVGEPFDAVVQRFGPALRQPLPLSSTALRFFGLTKSRRTPYDALMLQLHDAMKRDADYQRAVPQTTVDFPAGSTWIAFTDQVSHAAMSGQYQLEQTFLLPVDAMQKPDRSPLRILECVKGKRLV